MRKTILIAITAVAMSLNLAAQVDDTGLGLTNEEFFNNSEFIVEGRFIEWSRVSYDAKGLCNKEDIYTEIKFKVNYVYKSNGELIKQNDTIVIVFDRGVIQNKKTIKDQFGNEFLDGPNEIIKYPENLINRLQIDSDIDMILFLKTSDFPDNPSKRYNYFRTKLLQDRKEARFGFGGILNSMIFDKEGFTGKYDLRIKGLDDLIFENRYELYKYMEQFEGVYVPLSDPTKMRWDLSNDSVFNIYLKERNIEWRKLNSQERKDSLNNFLDMKYKKAKENR